MRIQLVTPAPRHSHTGNRVTAVRWARILRQLGHRVDVRQEWDGGRSDLLLALHARRSYPSIERFQKLHPELPLVVALTGTDLYGDLESSAEARQSLEWADRLIVLQRAALDELEPHLRAKTRVIYQSVVAADVGVEKSRRTFDVCVVGHLRPVKDPFRAARAARLLPAASRVRVVHAGGAMSAEMRREAEAEMAANRRYRWLGDRTRGQVRRLMARSRVMVLSSVMEGGANVVSEALVAGLPVVSSRIAGSIGMLGEDYPGYFEVGATEELADLLERCERDGDFLAELEARCRALAGRFEPAAEAAAWESLLAELRDP